MGDLGEVTKAIKDLSGKIDGMFPERSSRPSWRAYWFSMVGTLVVSGGCATVAIAQLIRVHAEESEYTKAVFTHLISKLREDPKHFDKTEEQFKAVIKYYADKINADRSRTSD